MRNNVDFFKSLNQRETDTGTFLKSIQFVNVQQFKITKIDDKSYFQNELSKIRYVDAVFQPLDQPTYMAWICTCTSLRGITLLTKPKE